MTPLLFAHPDWLVWCAGAIAGTGAALVFVFFQSRRRARLLLGSAESAGTLRALSDAALFAGLLLVALALLGPRFGHRTVLVSTAGVDTVVLLDVSRSMRAVDVPPNRLDRARWIARELLERLAPSDRVALAVYAGRGVVLTPLSPDAAALVALLPAIDTNLITPGGSNLRSGVEEALEAFDSASERPRVLVVLSDGEARGRSGDAGAASAVRANVRVVSVALGSEIGSTIPDGGAPLLDETQHVVVTRRRRAPLEKLASSTDGRLFVADEWGAVDLEALTREVRRGVTAATGENEGWLEERRTVPLVLPFAALAFGLLWLECARPLRLPRAMPRLAPAAAAGAATLRWLRLRKRTAARAAAAICALLPLLLIGAATETEHKAAADAAAWEALATQSQ